jgi:pyruvate/2-oxoglutarate/acetoin dehydrogenase E1 component
MTHQSLQKALSYREALNKAMHDAMASSDKVLLFGQGINDHKGIFGTTTGLADKFGKHRLIEVPLAEEGVTGICIGAALNGCYPINIHIRADFVLLAMNQIINLAAKYKYMFGGLFDVPMMVRLVIGRSWGQGAQHSQSLQSLFAHIPGLTVIMPASSGAIVDSYAYAVQKHRGPVISLEHRLMYDLVFERDHEPQVLGATPFSQRRVRAGTDVTIVSTSIMSLESRRAADWLADRGISCDVIDLHCVSHIDHDVIMKSVARTGRLLVADTSWSPYGVGAEICRIVCENDPGVLKAPVVTLGMAAAPCPTAKSLEDLYYPNLTTLSDSIARLVKGNPDHGVDLPHERSMADVYKRFKGPF